MLVFCGVTKFEFFILSHKRGGKRKREREERAISTLLVHGYIITH